MSPQRTVSTAGILLIAITSVCAAPPRAVAAVIDGNLPYEPQTELGGGAPEERRLDFRAEPGERNSLRVTRHREWILFRDRGAPLTASGFGCEQTGQHSARCRVSLDGSSPYYASPLNVRTYARSDRVVVSAKVTRYLYPTIMSGSGQDRVRMAGDGDVFGGSGNDLLVIRDAFQNPTIEGGSGNDRIELPGTTPASVDCGLGFDRYFGSESNVSLRCERERSIASR